MLPVEFFFNDFNMAPHFLITLMNPLILQCCNATYGKLLLFARKKMHFGLTFCDWIGMKLWIIYYLIGDVSESEKGNKKNHAGTTGISWEL